MTLNLISSKDFVSAVKKTAYLFKNIWREGTTTLLHAPRETDKTTTALSIASDLASKGREVLYVNTEDSLVGRDISVSNNLYIFTPEYESIDDTTDYADLVIEAIEQAVRTTSIRTFVVDSVSRIAALSFGKNASPAYVMKRLVALQIKCKLSILVVANDTTKATDNALLTLASSEITINNEEPKDTKDIKALDDLKVVEPISSDKSDQSARFMTPATSKMTCQQLRGLKRKIAKHPERYMM